MNLISTYNLDTKGLKIIDYDCVKSSEWENLICENEGEFSREGEYMAFDMNGLELVITYDLNVSGRVDYDPGDYYNPPYTDVDITSEDIDIIDATLDGYDIELTKDLMKLFLDVVKKHL